MFKVRNLLATLPALALLAGTFAFAAPALADTCSVTFSDSATGHSSDFQVANGSQGTVTFTLNGSASCSKTMTLASWSASNSQDLYTNFKNQKLVDSVTETLTGSGQHSMTVPVSGCFYQLDLLQGSSATAPDGTADYGEANPNPLMAWDQVVSNSQSCTQTTPTPPAPSYTCNALNVTATNDTVTVTGIQTSATNGATYTGVSINWGDNSTATSVQGTPSNVAHTYGSAGTYSIQATAEFSVSGQSQSVTASCPAKSVEASTPNTPPVTTSTTPTPTTTPTATQPAQLANTGPGDVIGIFGAVVIVAAVSHQLFVRRFARR